MCGGTGSSSTYRRDTSGLSPRVRGNRKVEKALEAMEGSIPACAGEPRVIQTRTRSPWVYPRVCGGTSQYKWMLSFLWGLSPRVRGNRMLSPPRDRDQGSIPACAGEPAAARQTCAPAWVYPRVCGGTATSSAWAKIIRGLSPRVRGNLAEHLGISEDDGSIPACAGEPPQCLPTSREVRVYPRVCGGTSNASD